MCFPPSRGSEQDSLFTAWIFQVILQLDSIIRSRAVEKRFFAHFSERNNKNSNNKTPIAATTTKKTTANEKFNNLTMATARPAGQSSIDEDQAAASLSWWITLYHWTVVCSLYLTLSVVAAAGFVVAPFFLSFAFLNLCHQPGCCLPDQCPIGHFWTLHCPAACKNWKSKCKQQRKY